MGFRNRRRDGLPDVFVDRKVRVYRRFEIALDYIKPREALFPTDHNPKKMVVHQLPAPFAKFSAGICCVRQAIIAWVHPAFFGEPKNDAPVRSCKVEIVPFPIKLVFVDINFPRCLEVSRVMGLPVATRDSYKEVMFVELTLNLETHFLLPVTTALDRACEEKDGGIPIVERPHMFLG